jgi:hypothetical protein
MRGMQKPKLDKIIFKNLVCTVKKTQRFPITEINYVVKTV